MRDLEDDIQATSESVVQDARRLIEVEREKQARGAGDARLSSLAREARSLTESMERKVATETALAEELARGGRSS